MRFLRLPIAVLTLTMVAVPRPAHAWFAFLDYLSGPGPFKSGYPTSKQGLSGGQFDFRLLCIMPQPHWTEAALAAQGAAKLNRRAFELVPGKDDKVRLSTFLIEHLRSVQIDPRFLEKQMMTTLSGESVPVNLQEKYLERFDMLIDPGDFAAQIALAQIADGYATSWIQFDGTSSAHRILIDEWLRAAHLLRALTVPTVSRLPGWNHGTLWARCADRPKNDPLSDPLSSAVHHADRLPGPSIQFTYKRLYSNWDSQPNEFAQGKRITMQIFEPKISVPISGRFDFLDAQSGIGGYYFSSSGFDSFGGWIIEPIAFDWHLPSALADEKCGWRLLQGFSFHTGFMLFPGGIAADKFGPGTPKISPGEAVFEMSVVYNITRLWN